MFARLLARLAAFRRALVEDAALRRHWRAAGRCEICGGIMAADRRGYECDDCWLDRPW